MRGNYFLECFMTDMQDKPTQGNKAAAHVKQPSLADILKHSKSSAAILREIGAKAVEVEALNQGAGLARQLKDVTPDAEGIKTMEGANFKGTARPSYKVSQVKDGDIQVMTITKRAGELYESNITLDKDGKFKAANEIMLQKNGEPTGALPVTKLNETATKFLLHDIVKKGLVSSFLIGTTSLGGGTGRAGPNGGTAF